MRNLTLESITVIQDIDYQNLNLQGLIDLKLNCNALYRLLDLGQSDERSGTNTNVFMENNNKMDLITLKNLKNLGDVAYGLLDNPYSDVVDFWHRGVRSLKAVHDTLTEDFLLEQFKQSNTQKNHPGYSTMVFCSGMSFVDWHNNIKLFRTLVEDYFELYNSQQQIKNLVLKALNLSDLKDTQSIIEGPFGYEFIELNSEMTQIQSTRININNWVITTTPSTTVPAEKNEKYNEFLRLNKPELFL